MRIDVTKATQMSAGGAARVKERKPAEETGAAEPPTDAIALTQLSRAVAEPAPSTPRIERLRHDVQAGTYQVPPATVAHKIVDFLEE